MNATDHLFLNMTEGKVTTLAEAQRVAQEGDGDAAWLQAAILLRMGHTAHAVWFARGLLERSEVPHANKPLQIYVLDEINHIVGQQPKYIERHDAPTSYAALWVCPPAEPPSPILPEPSRHTPECTRCMIRREAEEKLRVEQKKGKNETAQPEARDLPVPEGF